jgi:phosphate:Na+ symporter
MQQFEWFTGLLTKARGHYFAGFCVGALLTLLSQSSSAVAVVVIVLASSGILQPQETLMIIYGTNVGSAVGLWLLAFRERGVAKRLAMFEVMFNVVACAVLLPLFYVEVILNVPLVLAALQNLGLKLAVLTTHGLTPDHLQSVGLKQTMALAYLLFNLSGALIVIPLYGWLNRWLERRYPEDAADQAGRVQYLHPRATRDPASCLGLIVDDQNRLLERLGGYFSNLPEPSRRAATCAELFESGESLAHEIDPYLHDLIKETLPNDIATRLARLVERQRVIESLNREYFRIIPFVIEAAATGDEFAGRLREGFEATTLLVTEAVCSGQPGEIELAARVTQDGGDAIRRLQEAFTASATKNRSAAEQARLFQATTGLERLVWLLHALTRNAQALVGGTQAA